MQRTAVSVEPPDQNPDWRLGRRYDEVRPSRRVTVGDRSFATADPRIWNTLPRDVTTATSLLSFRRKLKTHLFRQSYPDIVV